MLIAQAEKNDVPVRTTDPAELFDDADLREVLVAFEAAHQVLRSADELAQVADDGVLVADTPYDEVVGIGLDYLTPEGTEDPALFVEAFRSRSGWG